MASAAPRAGYFSAVRGSADAVARNRRTREVPRGARRSPGNALIFMSWPHRTGQGMGRDCKEGQCRNNQREATFKRKEKKAGMGIESGWGGGGKKTKRPQPRPWWKISSHAQSPCRTPISRTWQKIPKPLEIGCTGFLQRFVPGLDQSLSIIYLSSFLGETDENRLPGLTDVSWCSCEALADGCWEFSLFVHFNSQSSSPRGARRSPPPTQAESSDVVSTSR